MAAQPVWLLLVPILLFGLLVGVGTVGFVLSKVLRQPGANASWVIVPVLMVLGGGALLLLLGIGFATTVSVREATMAESATIAEPAQSATEREVQEHFARLEQSTLPVLAPSQPVAPAPVVAPPPPMPATRVPSSAFSSQMSEHRPSAPQSVGRLTFLSLLILTSICFGGFFIARGLLSQSGPQRLVSGTVLAGLAAMSVAFLVVGLFFVRSQHQVTEVRQARLQELRSMGEALHAQRAVQSPVQAPAPAALRPLDTPDAPVSALQVSQNALTPLPTDDRTTVVESPAGPPSWVRAGVQKHGDVTTLVCSSQQFASVAEAEVDAQAAVRDYLLSERLRLAPSGPFGLKTSPSVEPLVQTVIRDRYTETLQRDFGSFFAPMHRVWLKAEITPTTVQQMQQAQVADLQEGRLLVAGSGLAALLCLPLGVVTYGQLNRWTNRRASRILQGAVSAAIVGLWTAGFVALQQFVNLF
jgi:hypothetical protein